MKGEELQLLKGVTANFKPGTMTALMGSSGAGKTTLLDVIAGRKTGGRIEGLVTVNGTPKDPSTFPRISAYCEQIDVHSPCATVYEALMFSANLRLPESVSATDKDQFVRDTIDLLDLTPLTHHMIGTLGDSDGLSLEQRKRITVGVELVSNPSILFLDEPTSGLDAKAAMLVMKTVQKVARSGRTIICTIHQPSVPLFNLFDNLLLLQRGGRTVFFGELGDDSENLLRYFESIPGTAKIKPQYNPATYMLEVIGAGVPKKEEENDDEPDDVMERLNKMKEDEEKEKNVATSRNRDYADIYMSTDLCKQNNEESKRLSTVQPEMKQFPPLSPVATSKMNQISNNVVKATKTYWRSPKYNFVRLVLFPLFAIIFGTTFFQKDIVDTASVTSSIALMYNIMDFIGVINMMTVLDITSTERTIFYNNQMSNMYSALPYTIAACLAEIPYLIANAIIFITIEYWLVGMEANFWKFLFFMFIFFLYTSFCTFLGQWMSFLLPNIKVANVAVGAIICVFNLFSGFLVPFVLMRDYISWLRHILPSSYALNAMVTSQLVVCDNGDETGCTMISYNDEDMTIAKYIETAFGFDPSKRTFDTAMLIGYVIVIQIAIYFTLKFVCHLKR